MKQNLSFLFTSILSFQINDCQSFETISELCN